MSYEDSFGTVIISIDTELAWGFKDYPDHYVLKLLRKDPSAGRNSIFNMLDLFDKYNIPATWAVVGHLFLDSCDRIHGDLPHYRENWYDHHGSNISEEPLYFGKDIIDKILSSPVPHEIACHTFSHVPFSNCDRDLAKAEILKSKELACYRGINIESFVFPESKIGHVDVLAESGIQIYRGANLGNIRRPYSIRSAMSFLIKNFIAPPVTSPLLKDGIWEVPGSIHFTSPHFPYMLVNRSKKGVNKAIKEKMIFHIILHCWSLLLNKSLEKDLEEFLIFLSNKENDGLKIMTMGKFAHYLNSIK